MAFVNADDAAEGTTMEVEVGSKRTAARVVGLPFYKRGASR